MDVSVIWIRELLSELTRQGHDAHLLLRRCGIDPARLTLLSETLTLSELSQLSHETSLLTGNALLGLRCGARAPENVMQVVGLVLIAQPTLRDVCGALERYAGLLAYGLTFQLSESSELAVLSCKSMLPKGDAARFVIDSLLTVLARLGARFAPEGASLHQVQLQHASLADVRRYERHYGCEVRLHADHSALVFARSYLDRKQQHADSTTLAVARDLAEQMLVERARRTTFTMRVQTVLTHATDLSRVDAGLVARRLNMHERGLRRQLYAEGTTITSLINEARQAVACRQLLDEVAIKSIADDLGFSEVSAFHRAFARWTGQTPARYRRSRSELQSSGKAVVG